MTIRADGPRVLLVLTSLARTSGGGHTFATGLLDALIESPDLRVVVVAPAGMLPAQTVESIEQLIEVKPHVGFMRIIRDFCMVHRWASKTRSTVALLPHEWAAPSPHVPLVNVVQNVLYFHPEGRVLHPLRSRVMRGLVKATARYAAVTICVSPSSASLWREFTQTEVVVLPEGIDPIFGAPGCDASTNEVVIMTGPHPHKNPALARSLCLRLLEESNALNVTTVGIGDVPGGTAHVALSKADLARLFARASIVVVTSSIESFGLPAFEARAAGAAVVVSKGTPMAEWLANDPHVRAADPEATAILAAIRELRESEHSRTKSQAFFWQNVGHLWAAELIRIARTQS